MSGPFPKDLKVRVKQTNSVDDERQYETSSVRNSFSETHRGTNPKTGMTGSASSNTK